MARGLNGTTQYLSNATALLTALPFSASILFNSDNTTQNGTLMSIGDKDATGDRWRLALVNASVRNQIQQGGGNSDVTTTADYSANTWSHAGASLNAGTLAAYLNGANKVTGAHSRVPTNWDTTELGRWVSSAPGNFADAIIAEAAFWNVVLDDPEFVALGTDFVCPLLIRPQSLIAYWSLFGRFDPEIDAWRGNNLTLNASPTTETHPRVYYRSRPHIWQKASAAAAPAFIWHRDNEIPVPPRLSVVSY